MKKEDIFRFAKTIINDDIKIYHCCDSGKYIFFNSKKYYAGEASEEFIQYWLDNA